MWSNPYMFLYEFVMIQSTFLSVAYDIFEKRGVRDKIRSRARLWEEGERSSKYFHSLEKKNGKEKSWNKILDKNGKMIHGTNDAQLCQVKLYKSLYSTWLCNNKEKEDDFLVM